LITVDWMFVIIMSTLIQLPDARIRQNVVTGSMPLQVPLPAPPVLGGLAGTASPGVSRSPAESKSISCSLLLYLRTG
jgi:hypothetical protein